jgi:hypothetical protein
MTGREKDLMSKRLFKMTVATTMVAVATLTSAPARAELLSYYIGVDDLPTLTSGTYSGLANPNFNHLTFLYAHWSTSNPASNHYHSKGIETYTGPAGSPMIVRSTSDFVPEGSLPPIKLSAGTGIYAGKLATNPYSDLSDPVYHFSFLRHGNTDSLAGFPSGSGEQVLHDSSGGRWNSPAVAAHLHAEIVSLTPGLNVGDASSLNLGGAGTELHLSDPGEQLDFTPILWTDTSAAPGVYEAVFRFFDEDGTFGDSGNIRFRAEVVPEPHTLLLVAMSCSGFCLIFRRRSVQ